ncbi:hypothetical protein F0U44_11970 [Nocardioides humilatus]|uniref:Cardiolipin synthase N-terminal domain-containing protein n=1 Tax=Nocardioides humilatus TaxID=2607660 RepID=A0A5B1LEV9_9ACTN|nr:PLDc N-terminal domain-containing protein [Nocardioides humilatus]KAA1419162.1 hypothetical protein F0U44_11970 [Nocardioides humilatus]
MIRFLPGEIIFVLWLFCVIDVIVSRDDEVRNLSKTFWLIIVLLLPLVGSIAWLVAGRPQRSRPLRRSEGAAPSFPEYERRGRFSAADPEKDDEFLRQVRERAEEQRRTYEAKKKAEREAAEAAEFEKEQGSED